MADTQRYLSALQSIAHMLPELRDQDDSLRRTLIVAKEAVGATGGSILMHDATSQALCFRHVLGGSGLSLLGESIGDTEGIAGQVFHSGKPQVDNNLATSPQHKKDIDEEFQFETLNMVTLPIRFPGGQTIGVMQLVNKEAGEFTTDDLAVLDVIGTICAMSIALYQNQVSAVQTRVEI